MFVAYGTSQIKYFLCLIREILLKNCLTLYLTRLVQPNVVAKLQLGHLLSRIFIVVQLSYMKNNF